MMYKDGDIIKFPDGIISWSFIFNSEDEFEILDSDYTNDYLLFSKKANNLNVGHSGFGWGKDCGYGHWYLPVNYVDKLAVLVSSRSVDLEEFM